MRLHDWQQRLSAVIAASRREPGSPEAEIAYGAQDCFIFAADCALALTGRDVGAPYRGRYRTIGEGLRQGGVKTLMGVPGLWFRRVPYAMAQRGDWTIARCGEDLGVADQPMLMVCDGVWLRGPCGGVVHADVLRTQGKLPKVAWRVE